MTTVILGGGQAVRRARVYVSVSVSSVRSEEEEEEAEEIRGGPFSN